MALAPIFVFGAAAFLLTTREHAPAAFLDVHNEAVLWVVGGSVATWAFAISAAVALVGAGLGFRNAVVLHRAQQTGSSMITSVLAVPLGLLGSAIGAGMALLTTLEFTRGRQIRSLGRVMRADLDEENGWLGAAVEPLDSVPEGVADAWRRNGQTEHASVAAFARVSMELVSLGAPPDLIEKAHRDAIDEMRHTELCFDLARDIDGRSLGPGQFPAAASAGPTRGPRAVRLARLAVDSLIDGATNEGVSARVVAELAKQCGEPRVRRVLEQIAKDEARHAVHAFEVVRWCKATGGPVVHAALSAAIRSMPEHLTGQRRGPSSDGRWERWGISGRAREEAAFQSVRARLIARTNRLLES